MQIFLQSKLSHVLMWGRSYTKLMHDAKWGRGLTKPQKSVIWYFNATSGR